MKKTTILSLLCISLIGFAGCGNKESSSGSSSDMNGAKDAVIEFNKATLDEPDGTVHYSYVMPDEAIKEAKASGEWDELVNSYEGYWYMDSEGHKYVEGSTKKVRTLKDKQLKYAETYFEDEYDVKVDINSGAEYQMTVEIFRKDRDNDKLSGTLCIYDIEGEGYKIIPEGSYAIERKYGDAE